MATPTPDTSAPLFAQARQLHDKALSNAITETDLDTIIAWPANQLSLLFAAADQVRRHYFTDTVDPCALMNIKAGGCSENCAFCSQSSHNHASITVHPLAKPWEIVDKCREATRQNLSFCVVSSGKRLPRAEINQVADALATCHGEKHASLGLLDDEEFAMLVQAGVVCYNHNIESSRNYFPHICTTHTFDQRIDTVKRAKAAGLRVCCGGIFGMGESWDDRKSMCLDLRALNVDTIPINFLNAVPGTRVAAPTESPLEFLRIVSMFRMAHPNKTIKVCGGRELHLGKLQGMMFFAGANGYVAGDYLTTKGDSVESDDRMIASLGLIKAGHASA
jgi:biotin synthase